MPSSTVPRRHRRAGRTLVALATAALLATVLPASASAQTAFPTTDDPRVGLAPGPGETAGQAISNLDKLASLPMAPGASTNSDLAFTGDFAISGNYNGFNVYDIGDPAAPTLRTSVICPGSQNDVSVYGDLLFMSVEATGAKIDCTTGGVTAANRFRGVRIWDISDIDNPVQLPGVQTCKGSHTHTIVEDPTDSDNVYVYVSGTASIRNAAEPPFDCTGASSLLNRNTDNFSITVIEVPLDAPETAAIANRNARIFSFCGDDSCEDQHAAGALNAFPVSNPQPRYPDGSGREPGGQSASQASTCHDITAYPELGLAAGACQGRGLLIDITDPANPRRIDAVEDFNFAYWHSATFNNDGTKVIFTDEWGGGSGARCRATDPLTWGANALFDIVETADGLRMEFASYFKLPMVQTNQENCVAHNGSLIPVPGRDIMIQAWYQGGSTVFDFTDTANPVEIAYFDRGPNSATQLQTGGFWSTYWYNGFIYGNEIARGFDVFDLVPSEHLSANEIEVAKTVRFDEVNPQGQVRYDFAPSFTLVRAYRDQAERAGLAADHLANVDRFLARAEQFQSGPQARAALANLDAVSNQVRDAGATTLADALNDLAASLR
jgi:hypothetical protein